MYYKDKAFSFMHDAEEFFARWDSRIQRGTAFVREARKLIEKAKELMEDEEFIALTKTIRDRLRAIKERLVAALRQAREAIGAFFEAVPVPNLSTNAAMISCGAILGMPGITILGVLGMR